MKLLRRKRDIVGGEVGEGNEIFLRGKYYLLGNQ
jgi:hypothetical protein